MDDFGTWLREQLARVSGKSRLGEKLRYIHSHWDGLQVFLTDGRVEIDSNIVERSIRPIALNCKNALFAPISDCLRIHLSGCGATTRVAKTGAALRH